MANKNADNEDRTVLYWTALGADTPVVWSYDCPEGTHKVVSNVKLQTNKAGSSTGADPTCPVHQLVLTGEAAVDVS